MGIFDFFKKNKNINASEYISTDITTIVNENELDDKLYLLNYPIKYNSSNPSKLFSINDLEEHFFENLNKRLTSKENSKINLTRMSDGTLNVCYKSYQVGRVKLQGRKYNMQVLYNLDDVEYFTGTLDDFIPKIDYWVIYILRYLK